MDSATPGREATVRSSDTLVLLLACAAEFMVVLDASVVNVALPAIQTGLGFDPVDLQWVVTSYTLVFAGLLLLGGRVADLYGVRRVLCGGLVVFTLASLAGGLAPSPAVLVAARAVQAVGAAVLAPASLTVLTTTFPEGPRRVRAIAVWTAIASGAGAAGSLLGGVLTDVLSWRSTLLVNLPVGVVAVLLARRCLAPDPRGADGSATARPRLDVPGAVAGTLGTGALTFAVAGVETRGWSSPVTTGALAVAVIALAAFVAHEGWWARSPLIPLRLFAVRAISVGNVAMVLAGACLMPMWYFLSLYMQQTLGLSAALTGLGFLPHTVLTVAVGARVAPWLMARFPARALLGAGALLAAAGFWWQSLAGPQDTYWGAVLGPAVVMSVGTGLLNTPLTTLVTTGVARDDAGAASGLMNTTKQVGGALGLAALVTVATAVAPPATGGAGPLPVGFSVVFGVMTVLMLCVAALSAALPRPDRDQEAPTRG